MAPVELPVTLLRFDLETLGEEMAHPSEFNLITEDDWIAFLCQGVTWQESVTAIGICAPHERVRIRDLVEISHTFW